MSFGQNGFLSLIPPVTKNLLIINLLCWLASLAMPSLQLNNLLGLHYFLSEKFNLAQLFTYMFMHGSFSHLFFNMFSVFMFGRTLEAVLGARRYLLYYLVTGVGAGIVQEAVWFWQFQSIPPQILASVIDNVVTIGASGAVFGILLAFGMLFPNTPLFLWFIPIPIKAKYFIGGYALIELYYGVSPTAGDNVAHFAHLGGMLFGVFMILYWRKKGINNGNFFF